jgi:predicted ribosome quality control (RQC) complex YloA/Tae2 family protein
MKYYILKAFCNYLSKFQNIKHIKRVENNTLKIEFTREEVFYFDMTKGNSTAYIKEAKESIKKDFRSPFDISLQKKFSNSTINKIYLRNDDKVLCFEMLAKSKYKREIATIQFEFTGKNTNVIILNEEGVILEALRHIDEQSSSRVVRPGVKLEELPKPNFVFKEQECSDVVEILKDIYKQKEQNNLTNVKKQKINQIKKQKQKLEKILNNLEDIEKLELQSDELYQKANLILANLHNIKPYAKEIQLIDFEGNEVTTELDTNYPTPSSFANFTFKSAKKLKQKALNQHLEQTNLTQKIEFFNRMIDTIENANSIDEIEFFLPKKDKKQTKTKKQEPYQSFFIDGYKIMLGRDERENIFLLENSKASDFWFHLQGQVSSHVIVSNTKKELPEHIIIEAAKICARFSIDSGGVFTVDYTQRRHVNIQSRANVLYTIYKTLTVKV